MHTHSHRVGALGQVGVASGKLVRGVGAGARHLYKRAPPKVARHRVARGRGRAQTDPSRRAEQCNSCDRTREPFSKPPDIFFELSSFEIVSFTAICNCTDFRLPSQHLFLVNITEREVIAQRGLGRQGVFLARARLWCFAAAVVLVACVRGAWRSAWCGVISFGVRVCVCVCGTH